MQNIATMKPQSYNSSISDSPIWSTAVVALALSFWRHRRLKKAEAKEISSLVGESKAGQRCFRLASISCLSVSDFMRPPNPYIFTFILWGLNSCHTRFDAFLSQRSREADLVSSTEKMSWVSISSGSRYFPCISFGLSLKCFFFQPSIVFAFFTHEWPIKASCILYAKHIEQ